MPYRLEHERYRIPFFHTYRKLKFIPHPKITFPFSKINTSVSYLFFTLLQFSSKMGYLLFWIPFLPVTFISHPVKKFTFLSCYLIFSYLYFTQSPMTQGEHTQLSYFYLYMSTALYVCKSDCMTITFSLSGVLSLLGDFEVLLDPSWPWHSGFGPT